jgi:hypothetical protein
MHRSFALVLRKHSVAWLGLCLVTALAFVPLPAPAQDGATCGTAITPDGALRDLGPCPRQNNAPPAPEPDLYTAIAVSNKTLSAGYSWQETSRPRAEQMALAHCQQQSTHPSDCKVVDWAKDDCLAFAWSIVDHTWAVDAGTNPWAAGNKALAGCKKARGTRCVIVEMPCSDHPPIGPPQ